MRREPVRTCVGCRGRAAKRVLLRVVAGAGGEVQADPAARAPGRGAYVHPDEECVLAAVRRGAFSRALRTGPHSGGAARLLEAIRSSGPNLVGDRAEDPAAPSTGMERGR